MCTLTHNYVCPSDAPEFYQKCLEWTGLKERLFVLMLHPLRISYNSKATSYVATGLTLPRQKKSL
jgi:hypothetical protein